jgi:hypothetical protein
MGLYMKKMISFCGLLCSECGAFIATQSNDDKKRAEVAQIWSKQYGVNLKPEDINCDGCISDSDRLIGHTRVCEIRKCGKQKGIANCAYCGEYPCTRLEDFFKVVPDNRKRLDEIKNGL